MKGLGIRALALATGLALSSVAVAKEKCDTFAGDAKANCVNDAKARFGKS